MGELMNTDDTPQVRLSDTIEAVDNALSALAAALAAEHRAWLACDTSRPPITLEHWQWHCDALADAIDGQWCDALLEQVKALLYPQ